MVDGSIVISTKIDNSGVQGDTRKMADAFKRFSTTVTNILSGSSKSVQNIRQRIVETNIAIEEVQRQMRRIVESAADSDKVTSRAFENAKLKVEQTLIAMGNLERQMEAIAKSTEENLAEFYKDPEALDMAVVKALESDIAYQKLGARFDSLLIKAQQYRAAVEQAHRAAIASVGTQSREYKALEKRLANLQTRLKQYNSRLLNAETAAKKASASAGLFGRGLTVLTGRIGRLVASIFVFNVLRKGFTLIRNYLAATLKTSNEFNQSLARVKGNLLTAFQPIYDAIQPRLVQFMKWLERVTAQIAIFISALAGKTVKQSALAAKNLNEQAKALQSISKTAKEATGSLAGFDEINQLNQQGLATGADLPEIDFTGYQVPEETQTSIQNFADKIREIWNWIVENQPLVNGALTLFGLALISVFGPNIVAKIIGFKLLFESVGGAIRLVQEIMSDGEITWVRFAELVGIAGKAVLGLGLILGLPKVAGFGLILWGISELLRGFTDLLNGNGNAWENLKRVMMGTGMIVIGAFLMFGSSVGIAAAAIGAFVIAAAAISSVWDKLSTGEKVLAVLALAALAAAAAIAIFHTSWSVGLAAAAIGLALVGLATTFALVKGKMGLGGGGVDLSLPSSTSMSLSGAQNFGSQNFSANPLPRLAKGAVIPANREFLAVLGDQKYGRNIETPERLLREIFRDELSQHAGGDITLNARIELEDGPIVGRFQRRFTRQGRLIGVR